MKTQFKRILVSVLLIQVVLISKAFSQLDSAAFHVQESPEVYAQTTLTNDLRLTDFTLESWIFLPNGTNSGATLEKHIIETYGGSNWGGYVLRVSTSGTVKAWVMGANGQFQLTGQTLLPTNEWIHIATTYNSTTDTFKVFVNGVEDASTVYQVNASTTYPSSIYFGARGDDQSINLQSYIDEVRIWNYARTTAQINSDMNGCLSGNESGLLVYYDFENLSNNGIINDKTSNNNNATVINSSNPYLTNGAYTCNSPTGITENTVDFNFNAYPNPTNKNIRVNLNQTYDHLTVVVRNMLGQELQRSSVSSVNSIELELMGEKGIYFVEISNKDKRAVLKVIKE